MEESVLVKECQGDPHWTSCMFLDKTIKFLNGGKET